MIVEKVVLPTVYRTLEPAGDPRHSPRVVAAVGEHDISTVDGLRVRFVEAISGGESDLVVDLSGVTFMDASIIGLLVRTRNFLDESSHQLTLASPSASAVRVLEACQLTGPDGFHILGSDGTAGTAGASLATVVVG